MYGTQRNILLLRSLSKVLRLGAKKQRIVSSALKAVQVRGMASEVKYEFETMKVSTASDFVKHVELNRPEKRNAMNKAFWSEIIDCFATLNVDPDCRVVLLSGAGKLFSSGIDLSDPELLQMLASISGEVSRNAFRLRQLIHQMQESFNCIEKCNKPVVSAIHGACLGAAVDMISACDIRVCTKDTWFQIKEIDMGFATDIGTIQRFPKIIGNDSLARELIYTGRKFEVDEAKSIGFVGRVFENKIQMMEACLELCSTIADKSPVATQGSKVNLIYSRDHSVPQGLEYITTWNSAMLQSEDVAKAVQAAMTKDKPSFSKL